MKDELRQHYEWFALVARQMTPLLTKAERTILLKFSKMLCERKRWHRESDNEWPATDYERWESLK